MIGADDFDDVLILGHRAVVSEAGTFGIERQDFIGGIERSIVRPEVHHDRSDKRPDEFIFLRVVAQSHDRFANSAARHFSFAFTDRPETAERSDDLLAR